MSQPSAARLDDLGKIADGARLRHLIQRNLNIEMILDFHHEIHDRNGIDVEVGGDVRLRREHCLPC